MTAQDYGFEVTAEMMIQNVMQAMKAKAIEQAADQTRMAYIAATYATAAAVKKMNAAAAIRAAAAIGVQTDDRYTAIWAVYDARMAAQFGDYVMEPSAAAMIVGFENVATQEVSNGRFTAQEIKDIRIARMMGKSYAAIKKDGNYSVSKDMIRSICIGECYKDVATAYIEVK